MSAWLTNPQQGTAFLLAASEGPSMAQPNSPIEFENIPIAEARMITRAPRMDPLFYQTLKEVWQRFAGKWAPCGLGRANWEAERPSSSEPIAAAPLQLIHLTTRDDTPGCADVVCPDTHAAHPWCAC